MQASATEQMGGRRPGSDLPEAGAPGQPPVQPASKSTPEQRAAWAAKRARAKAKKSGQANPNGTAGAPGATLADDSGAAGGNGAQVVSPPPIPWTADIVRPLVSELIPIAERLDVEGLKKVAVKISTEAVALVGEKGQWNPAAKATVISSGSNVAAKWLNKSGISSENCDEVALGIALVTIIGGRMMLKSDLEELAIKLAAARERQKTEEKERANHPNP